MLIKNHAVVSGFLICGGLGLCALTMGVMLARSRVSNPIYVVVAIFWSLIGAIYLALRMP
jgi:hypothetical protein